MKFRTRGRQLLLILVAVLLPAGVLILLARQVTRQEAELAAARAIQEHRNTVEQLGRELAARLEAIKLQEINRWIRVPAVRESDLPLDDALVFVAPFDEDRIVLPWESPAIPHPAGTGSAGHRHEGENLEFIKQDLKGALDSYRQAISFAVDTTQRCDAMLLEARVLLKQARLGQARNAYRSMLKDCDTVRDDEGMPFSLYAAERLMNGLKDTAAAQAYAVARLRKLRWTSPYEGYLLRALLDSASDEEGVAAREDIARRLVQTEQILAFSKDFARLRPLAETAWVGYGREPWLVTVAPPEPPLPALVFVVSSAAAARKFLPVTASLVVKDTPGSDALPEAFHAVGLKLATSSAHPAPTLSRSFYTAGIALIVAATVLAVLLLLRDVNRELRMAEMRSHFVASVSHELKTPLTAIRMFAETLALGRARDEQTRTEYLDTIVNESERLTRLVDNVLDFSKIEQGKKMYRMRPTSLADVARSAAQAMEYPLSQQGFTLNVSVAEGIPSVAADADALQQALLNLLSNAMKYSGNAREIDLGVRHSGSAALLEVTDRGIGIAAQEQPRIFEKFYRGRSAHTDSIGGTGLGLTVVHHIVQAHGGTVEVASVEGKGSTFTVRLPLASPERPA